MRRPRLTPHLVLRERRRADLPRLLAVLQERHERDGYPVRAEAVAAWWLAADDELVGLVVLAADRPVGHVALHPCDGRAPAVEQWETSTGRAASRLAVVSRLFTDRSVAGAGTALLTAAVDRAAELDRTPVLQVDPDSAARGWYAHRGWRQVGTVRQQWGHRTVDAVLMVAPGS